MTTTLTEVLNIDCPKMLAFDLMADVEQITRWNGGASKSEMIGEEPIGKGSQFKTVNRGQEMASTITTFERPDRLEFAVNGKAMDVHGTFIFTETDTGTRLDMAFEASPKGIMRVLFPLLKPLIRRDLVNQHLKFKGFCEAQNSSMGGAVPA